jgi:histidinol-phosphate aminotransferase
MYSSKRNIERIILPVHGGIDRIEMKRLGISPDKVTDFSVSLNPFGPPPGIREAIDRAAIDKYPDSESIEVREQLAKKLRISPESILVGSGSTEIIRLIATAFFGINDIIVIPQPTYGEYETACQLVGTRTLKPWMLGEVNFRLNISRLKQMIDEYQPQGLFLCNPNNPTGEYLSRDVVNNLLYLMSRGILVLDEAYVAFTEDPWSSIELLQTDHLIVVRSMTKDFALPGLRLGYALGPPQLISILNRVKPPWNVSSVAQAAATFVLNQDSYLVTCGERLRDARKFLVSGLQDLGFLVIPSEANFFMVKVADAAGFRQTLLTKGFLVRDCTSFGLPTYVRLAPRTLDECKKLLVAIDTPEVRSYAC